MRILLVEDEIKLSNAIKRALELQKYTVDSAYNGKNALDIAIGEKFDLIILDLMLPELSGIEVCKKIREEKIHTPILMLTAKGQTADKVIGLDIGADDYMVKPFSFEELFARIRALVRRPVKTQETTLRIGNLSLDPNTFQVKRGKRTISLSIKEYAMLEYLMRNKNSVLSKEQILSHVWEYDTDVLPTTVEVHMKHLRDKIEIIDEQKLIKTIRGRGYTITEG